jgi:hypothetical protein
LSTPSEGTVDFLVFYLIGILGKLGLPLVELLLFQSWLGGFLCALAIEAIAKILEIPKAKNWAFFIATFFPPLILNSGLGFGATIYASAILWAIYYTFLNQQLVKSLCILALIPVIRWEGFWFLSLCYLHYLFTFRRSNLNILPLLTGLALGLIPICLLAAYRITHFQSWIPVPVVYKSSLGNLFYLILGFRNLFLDTISSFSLAFLILWILVGISERQTLSRLRHLWNPLMILMLSTLPYYLSGGDWFPPSFGRYFLPFTLALLPFSWKLISACSIQNRKLLTVGLALSLFLCGAAPTSSLIRFYELLFSHGSALLSLNLKKRTENPLYRPHYLSALGLHLKKTTSTTDHLGTSELATISYFSERDAVDFLGLTDIKLAKLPLRETPSFVRKNPKAAELPLLIFKRIAPERVNSLQPDYLYLFDFMIEILMDEKSTDGWRPEDFSKALKRWDSKFKGLVGPLYGGTKNLLSLGYTPIVITYDNDFCALYFVHARKLEGHRVRLKTLGFTETSGIFDSN